LTRFIPGSTSIEIAGAEAAFTVADVVTEAMCLAFAERYDGDVRDTPALTVRIARFAALVRDCKVVIRVHERARSGCGQCPGEANMRESCRRDGATAT
jgi:hypothetical protein